MFPTMLSRVSKPKPPIRPHIFTLGESPRFTRELWDRFRATAAAHGWQTIDAVRTALEMFIQNPPEAPKDGQTP